MKKIVLALLLIFLVVPPVFAYEVAPRISDREIIDKLSGLDAKIDKETANIRGDIKRLEAGQTALQHQINDLKESTNTRFDDMNKRFDTLQWMLGLFITIALSMMGAMWWMLIQQQQRLAKVEQSLETQKDEINFLKTLIEKLLPPRGIL